MRKILHISFYLLCLALFLHSAHPTYANPGPGQNCNPQLQQQNSYTVCPANLLCRDPAGVDPNVPGTVPDWHCLNPDGTDPTKGGNNQQPITCKCQKENDASNTNFTCGNSTQTAHCIANPGIDGCYSNNNQPVSTDPQNNNAYSVFGTGKKLVGVQCMPTQELANCTCDNNGNPSNGKNGFSCKLQSNQSVTGTATCNSGQACTNAADNTNGTAQNQNGDLFSKHHVLMKGVMCATPVAQCTCDNPGKDGNMSCTFNGQKDTASCKDNQLCTVANPQQELPKDAISKTLFNGVNLEGAACQPQVGQPADPADPTEPPPPSPPCEKLAADGTCASFATGIGSIATDTAGFITKLFAVLLSISGGIALFLIIRAGYTLMTSQGKPDQINQGREQIIAAIVGLLFLIFSFVILEIIGIDILRVPDLISGGTPGALPGSPGSTCNTDTDCKAAGDVCVKDAAGGYGTCRLPVPSPNQGGPGTGQSCSCVGSSQLCKQIGGQQGNGGTCASPQVYCCY